MYSLLGQIITRCLDEASHTQSPVSLHRLFVIILMFCSPSNPYELWLQFKDKLSEDHVYQLTRDPSFDSILNDINEDRKSTRLNSSHSGESRMPSSA